MFMLSHVIPYAKSGDTPPFSRFAFFPDSHVKLSLFTVFSDTHWAQGGTAPGGKLVRTKLALSQNLLRLRAARRGPLGASPLSLSTVSRGTPRRILACARAAQFLFLVRVRVRVRVRDIRIKSTLYLAQGIWGYRYFTVCNFFNKNQHLITLA